MIYRSVSAKIKISASKRADRYTGIPRYDRICKVCNTGSIENEQHFMRLSRNFRQGGPGQLFFFF